MKLYKIYKNLFTADITQPIKTVNYTYQGIISSGTFTHGHVGPSAIENLLSIAQGGAYFALSVNKDHWLKKGFATQFKELNHKIDRLLLHEVLIYGDHSKVDHRNDLAIVVTFQKV